MSKVLQERGFGSLPSSTETNPRDQVKSISTTIKADSHSIRRIRSPQYAVSSGQNHYSKASHIDESIPQKEKDPGSFTLPCFINNVCFDNALIDLGASVSVMPLLTYLNLGLGELTHTKLTVELADRTVKYPKGIVEYVLVRIGKFTFPVDFIILNMPEDIKVPLILGRPFLSTSRAKINVYKRKITLRVGEEKIVFTSVKPASSLIKRVYMLSLRERIELDLEARLMGETLVRNQGDDLMPTIEECGVIEEFRTRDEDLDTGIDDYPILENIDAYRDEGMGDVIIGEPFLREVGYKARWFDRMITIYSGDDEVTYQIVRSHPRYFEDYYSEDQYAVSIKEDTAYLCLYSPKRPQRNKAQYAVSREDQYTVLEIWNEYNILEDIKRGPYSKKSPIRRIQSLDTPRFSEEKKSRRGQATLSIP
ncbi:hypothetical protein Tco_0219010 [Tanacetum coccineum]